MLNVTPWVRITVRDLGGNIKDQVVLKNTITDLLFNLYRDALAGDVTASELEILGMGVGDDDTPPLRTNTWLGNETFRKLLTSSSKPAIGQYNTVFYIAPAEAVGVIEELGWFAGPLAVGIDTGTLIARVLYSRVKTNLESIDVERLDSIEEA
uniref:Uncharacterized protein n=1 Tax=viral metagenome TaxID=1070528 RepID=A0A6M3MBP6_9ZZZZ